MTHQDAFTIFPMKMHGTAKAIFVNHTIFADTCFHPAAVAKELKTVFPNVKEVVMVDVALCETAVDVGAGGDGAIDEDGSDGDAGTAEVVPITDLALVGPDVGFAAELGIDLAFLAGGDDEVHQLFELLVVELKIRVVGGTPNGLDSEETPGLHMVFDKQLL